ncbi:MAG: hypothetical protein WAO61_08800 [Solirubrobacterales bacterium]
MKAWLHTAQRKLMGSMRALRSRRYLPVVLCPLVAATVALVYGQTIPHTYEAKAEIAIALSAKQLARQRGEHGESVLRSETLAKSWSDIPAIYSFRDQVAAKPGIGYTAVDLKRRLRGRHLNGTSRIWISATSADASRAALLADLASKNMLVWVRQWPRRPATAKIVTPAREPRWPVDPDIPNAVLVAAMIGLSIGSIAAMLIPASPAAGSPRAVVPG